MAKPVPLDIHALLQEQELLNIAQDILDKLGANHKEPVYKQSMLVALRHVHKNRGFQYDCERVVPLIYEGHHVGNAFADIVIRDEQGNEWVIELKVAEKVRAKVIEPGDEQQLKNYLRFLGIEHGYVIAFPKTATGKVQVKSVNYRIKEEQNGEGKI